MRILWISTWNSDLHSGGVGTYSRGILELLRAAYPLAEIVRLEPGSALSPSRHRFRQAVSVARSVASARSAKWHFDHRAETGERLRSVLRESLPDLVVFNGTAAGEHAALVPPTVPSVFVIPGVDSLLYERQIATSPLPLRWLFRDVLKESRKHARFEGGVLARADGCIAISQEEAERVRAVAGRAIPCLVTPPLFGHEPAVRGRGAGPRVRLAFLGKFSWWPNREAIEWFLGEVWPSVDAQQVELHLYGEGSEAFSGRAANVHGHGYQDELGSVWRDADVFINPMRSNTGVNVKVCEAIYAGVPVLSSAEGMMGLALAGDPAVVVCRTAGDWVTHLGAETLDAFSRTTPSESSKDLFRTRRRVPGIHAFLDSLTSNAKCRSAASSA